MNSEISKWQSLDLTGLSFQSGPSEGTFLYGKTSAELRLELSPPHCCFSPSLSTQIPSMRSRFVLHDAVWAPQLRSYQPFSSENIILPLIRIQLWSHHKENTGDRKPGKQQDGAPIQESAAAPDEPAQSHLLQEEGWRLKKFPSGCSQGLTTDSGGKLEVLRGVSVGRDFAFCWPCKPDIILCDIGLEILFTPPTNSCYAC